MIVVSDNTAANLLIDLVGIDAVNRSMRALGLGASVLEHKFFHAPPGAPPSRSTPPDRGSLMMQIAGHALLARAACEQMLGILRRQHHSDQLRRRIAAD